MWYRTGGHASLIAILTFTLSCGDGKGGDTPTGPDPDPKPRSIQANITAPTDGASVEDGQSVLLAGTGTGTSGQGLSGSALSWQSSIDGALGTGQRKVADLARVGPNLALFLRIHERCAPPTRNTPRHALNGFQFL